MRLSQKNAESIVKTYGSPLYVYNKTMLRERAKQLINLQLPYGHTVRYAIKANPHAAIVKLFDEIGLHFDASSSYEATFLLEQGIAGEKISLSSQQPAHNLPQLLAAGVQYVATSLHQLKLYTQVAPNTHVAIRVNAGVGSGHNNRTTTAGPNASFGIWHEYLDDALQVAAQAGVSITRLHMHIGSGADPSQWGRVIDTALSVVAKIPQVTTLDIGGGYKVARIPIEQEAILPEIAAVFSKKLQAFARQTGRQLHLEIEPGTWLVAHAGALITQIVDIVDTGSTGYTFLRTNTGMNDLLRPTLYGAQHTIRVLNDAHIQKSYVVVGHNCESGDILTPAPGDPEAIEPRMLNQAHIGDLLVIEDVGAYGASLRASGYNAYPAAKEIIVEGNYENICKR